MKSILNVQCSKPYQISSTLIRYFKLRELQEVNLNISTGKDQLNMRLDRGGEWLKNICFPFIIYLNKRPIHERNLWCFSYISKLNLLNYQKIIFHLPQPYMSTWLNMAVSQVPSLCIKCFHLLARKPNSEKCSIYSNKFFHNFHLSESSFTCPGLQASRLAWRLKGDYAGWTKCWIKYTTYWR